MHRAQRNACQRAQRARLLARAAWAHPPPRRPPPGRRCPGAGPGRRGCTASQGLPRCCAARRASSPPRCCPVGAKRERGEVRRVHVRRVRLSGSWHGQQRRQQQAAPPTATTLSPRCRPAARCRAPGFRWAQSRRRGRRPAASTSGRAGQAGGGQSTAGAVHTTGRPPANRAHHAFSHRPQSTAMRCASPHTCFSVSSASLMAAFRPLLFSCSSVASCLACSKFWGACRPHTTCSVEPAPSRGAQQPRPLIEPAPANAHNPAQLERALRSAPISLFSRLNSMFRPSSLPRAALQLRRRRGRRGTASA